MRFFLVLWLCFCTSLFSQNQALAKDYFDKGDFKKALYEYKKLYANSPSNISYINQIIATHQQLEEYQEAETFLLKLINRIKYPAFLVEIGYNYQLKNDLENANTYYNKAINSLNNNVNYAFAIAQSFKKHNLLNKVITVYKKAMALNPKLNFNFQLAKIYGEQGDIKKMFTCYIELAETSPTSINNIKRYINDFISENSMNTNNILLKTILLKKTQQNPNILWNKMLSWLFIQQKDLKKAFIQEKAIFNRQPESLNAIENIGTFAVNEKQYEIAEQIFSYLIEHAQDLETQLNAHYNLLQIKTKQNTNKKYDSINNRYLELFEQFGILPQTLKLQISYADFLAFYKNQPKQAITFLEATLKLHLTKSDKAKVKLKLGDILVFQEKFNKALIYYTQIQRNLKNSTISQEARYKVAKTSYYKGDFKWAESQLKILKASTSQLIANDALDLKLLITDNKYEDSLQTALKLYAKANLLAFQNKTHQSILVLNTILKNHKTEPIIAQTLFKQAQLFEKEKAFEKAQANYQLIIANYSNSILIDDAYYKLANIYKDYLNTPEKAKSLYEQIIFNHADSIYFIEARKKYRALRGDTIN